MGLVSSPNSEHKDKYMMARSIPKNLRLVLKRKNVPLFFRTFEKMTAKKEDKTILKKLEEVPFSFNLHINNLTQRQAKIVLTKLRREYDCQEYEHPEEIKRYLNLTTYLHYLCRNVEEAKQCNREALEKDPESIVALGNKAWIYHRENNRNEDFKEIENIITRIEAICLNRENIIVAKAEIAYSYARFGMMYYKQAESIYREVLAEVMDGDKLPSVLWQYGCGLLNRRILAIRIYGIQENVREDEDIIMRAADLLFKVAKNGTNYRLAARAWAELGNLAFAQIRNKKWRTLIPTDMRSISADEMFRYADMTNKKISDIPVLEQCANHFKRTRKYDECEKLLRNSLGVKESSRAYQWLAEVLKIQFMKKMNGTKEGAPKWIPDCEETREILRMYDSAIETQQNVTAMGCKGKFLMEMGKIMEAVDIFENIYRLVHTTETQPEECDHNVKVFCQIYIAKCLLYLSSDETTITRAKDLLRFAIEMTLRVRQRSEQQRGSHCRQSTDNQSHITSSITQSEFDSPGLPRITKLLKEAVEEMQKLLRQGRKTIESRFDEIALCALLEDKKRVHELCEEIEGMRIDTTDQSNFAQLLINNREYGKGLFHLNQMIICGTLPEEMKEFAIRAHVDGAMDALKKDDLDFAVTRLRAAFDFRFPKKNISIKQEHLDIFLLANECKKDTTWKLQEIFGNLTKLKITSCFDTMPGELIFGSIDNSIQQSSVIAILLGEGDMTNGDSDSALFKILVESVRMDCKEQHVLIVITLSDLSVIPSYLRNIPQLSLVEPLKNAQEWMHTFFLQTLIKKDL